MASHKYLDQLTEKEFLKIHQECFSCNAVQVISKHHTHSVEIVMRPNDTVPKSYSRHYEPVYQYSYYNIECKREDNTTYYKTYKYSDFGPIGTQDTLYELDIQLVTYRSAMIKRFGIPYVLDMIESVLYIPKERLGKMPIVSKGNRLKKILKGVDNSG